MNATDLIRAAEGLRLAAYDDATGEPVPVGGECRGTLTIGYGHTGDDVKPGDVITRDKAEDLLAHDCAVAMRGACLVVGPDPWSKLDVVRQAVLVDMTYNIGQRRLSEFARMLVAIRAGDWLAAHDEALASLWASQVGDRAKRDAFMLLTGRWPA